MNKTSRREAQPARFDRATATTPIASSPVRLADDFGFINEYDAVYLKRAGTIIDNPIEIEVLRARGARLEDLPC